jgi:hypothetical protein
MGTKTLPTIWGTYNIWSLWPNIRFLPSIVAEKNVTKNVHIYSMCVYKNQLSRQTGIRNLTGPKTLPTIWYTYMTLVTKYQISAINSYWEKCDEKYRGRTNRGKTVYPPFGERGYKNVFGPIAVLVTNRFRLDQKSYLPLKLVYVRFR